MNFKNHNVNLIGDRIVIRTLTDADATERYSAWLSDPEINHYLATKSATVEELKKYIHQKDESPDAFACMIFLKDGMRPIGTIKLEKIDLQTKRADIALMLGEKDTWGKGLMREAMEVVMQYGFSSLGLDVIYLGVASENTRAINLYRKLGFQEVRRDIGGWTDTVPHCDHVWMELHRSAVLQ